MFVCAQAVRLVCDSGTRPSIHPLRNTFIRMKTICWIIHHGHFIRHYPFEVSVLRTIGHISWFRAVFFSRSLNKKIRLNLVCVCVCMCVCVVHCSAISIKWYAIYIKMPSLPHGIRCNRNLWNCVRVTFPGLTYYRLIVSTSLHFLLDAFSPLNLHRQKEKWKFSPTPFRSFSYETGEDDWKTRRKEEKKR